MPTRASDSPVIPSTEEGNRSFHRVTGRRWSIRRRVLGMSGQRVPEKWAHIGDWMVSENVQLKSSDGLCKMFLLYGSTRTRGRARGSHGPSTPQVCSAQLRGKRGSSWGLRLKHSQTPGWPWPWRRSLSSTPGEAPVGMGWQVGVARARLSWRLIRQQSSISVLIGRTV